MHSEVQLTHNTSITQTQHKHSCNPNRLSDMSKPVRAGLGVRRHLPLSVTADRLDLLLPFTLAVHAAHPPRSPPELRTWLGQLSQVAAAHTAPGRGSLCFCISHAHTPDSQWKAAWSGPVWKPFLLSGHTGHLLGHRHHDLHEHLSPCPSSTWTICHFSPATSETPTCSTSWTKPGTASRWDSGHSSKLHMHIIVASIGNSVTMTMLWTEQIIRCTPAILYLPQSVHQTPSIAL